MFLFFISPILLSSASLHQLEASQQASELQVRSLEVRLADELATSEKLQNKLNEMEMEKTGIHSQLVSLELKLSEHFHALSERDKEIARLTNSENVLKSV